MEFANNRDPVISYTLSPLWWITCNSKRTRTCVRYTDFYGFSVAGGYEHAKLLYVEDINSTFIKSESADSETSRPLRKNDLLLEVNGFKLTGMCTTDIYAIMRKLWNEGKNLDLKVVPGSFLNNDFELIYFLQDNTFPVGSFRRRLQLSIRQIIYHQYLPITSRPAEEGEFEPVFPHNNYYFWTKEQIEEGLNEGSFLERGEFNGNFYGTVIPFRNKNFGVYFEQAVYWLEHPPPARRMSFKKAIGMVRGVAEDIPESR